MDPKDETIVEELQKTEVSTSIEENDKQEPTKTAYQEQETNVDDVCLKGDQKNQQGTDQQTEEASRDSFENLVPKEPRQFYESNVEIHETVSPQADEDSSILKKSFETHPYKQLLLNFQPSEEQLSPVDNPQFTKTIQQTPLVEISAKEDLENLVKNLKEEKEIGIDLEYSDHGYKALTCLVQISTNNKDYIIDTIVLKSEMHMLNEIFTDSNIVKIFHAASNDLKWLQQDFYLFVVNMFDTQQAMKKLGRDKIGLDALLRDNFNVTKDKRMQREDFRKRPLPPKYKDYARTDTHYLIPIYHKLKNELIEANLLREVFNDCNNACKLVYEVIEDGPYISVVNEIKKMHQRQLLVLEKLNKWRHRVAEYLDQNTGYILSKNNLKALVVQMPCDSDGILKIAKSAHVKDHLQEIVNIMREGRPEKPFGVKRNLQSSQKRYFTNQKKRQLEEPDFGSNQIPGFSGHRKRHKNYRGGYNNAQGSFDLRNTLNPSTTSKRSNARGKSRYF